MQSIAWKPKYCVWPASWNTKRKITLTKAWMWFSKLASYVSHSQHLMINLHQSQCFLCNQQAFILFGESICFCLVDRGIKPTEFTALLHFSGFAEVICQEKRSPRAYSVLHIRLCTLSGEGEREQLCKFNWGNIVLISLHFSSFFISPHSCLTPDVGVPDHQPVTHELWCTQSCVSLLMTWLIMCTIHIIWLFFTLYKPNRHWLIDLLICEGGKGAALD